MNAIWLGVLCGLGFGVVDVLIMLPMKMENRTKKIEAVTSAFIERFMLGFLIPNISLGIHPVTTGILLGLTLSLPSAIITRAYAPIVGIGVAGGIIIGVITSVGI